MGSRKKAKEKSMEAQSLIRDCMKGKMSYHDIIKKVEEETGLSLKYIYGQAKKVDPCYKKNEIERRKESIRKQLSEGFDDGFIVYFLNSYYNLSMSKACKDLLEQKREMKIGQDV